MRVDIQARPALAKKEKREEGIRLWRAKCHTNKELGMQFATRYLVADRWVRAYQAESARALKRSEQKGRPVGSGRQMRTEAGRANHPLPIDKAPLSSICAMLRGVGRRSNE